MKKRLDFALPVRVSGATFPFKRFLRQRMFVILFLLAISVFFIILFNEGKTESAIFYPESCLGGWENPQLAQGPAETESPKDFNRENSAVLSNFFAEIYCGGFSGEIPENSRPEKVLLKFGLTIKSISSSTEEFYPEALNQGTTTEIIFSPTIESEVSPAPGLEIVLPQEETVLPTPEESPVSFFRKIFMIAHFESALAHAEEIISSQEPQTQETTRPSPESAPTLIPEPSLSFTPEPSPEAILEPTVSMVASSTPEVLLESPFEPTPIIDQDASSTPLILLEIETNQSASSTEIFSEEEALVPSLFLPELMEIFYSFDGINWSSLGRVNLPGVENSVFEIPDFDWDELSQLQIKISSLPNELTGSEILLEHVALEVVYSLDFSTVENILQPSQEQEGAVVNTEDNDFDGSEQFVVSEPIVFNQVEDKPVLKQRKFEKKVKVDNQADHGCYLTPFSQDISGVDTGLFELTIVKGSVNPSVLEIGSLPDGIDIIFSGNKDHAYYLSQNETVIGLEIINQSGSQVGDFTIPIIYTQNGVRESSVICQVNIINQ